MTDDQDARVERCRAAFRRIHQYLGAGNVEDWATLSLTMAQYRTLVRLQSEGPLTVGRLAQKLGVTLPSVTGTVDRLVGQGLVERRADPTDRRLVINQLTDAGHALIERLLHGRRARFTALLRSLPADQLAATEEILVALAEAGSSLLESEPTATPPPADDESGVSATAPVGQSDSGPAVAATRPTSGAPARGSL